MANQISVCGLSLILALAAGCAKKSEGGEHAAATAAPAQAEPAAPVVADPAAEARSLFKARCVVCHGESGKGDGPGAAALNPKPRDYSDAAWQASVTDEQIKKTILFGGAAIGKSPNMPGNPDLEAKPAVVDELVKRVRSFKSQ
jgi:mono/diheme cytochrome c family protein